MKVTQDREAITITWKQPTCRTCTHKRSDHGQTRRGSNCFLCGCKRFKRFKL